mmetsp:Transcript_27030/g.92919  ORF Transcript_27030/g.92919 Transcript_27030/m.92919 type:complete len:331 (-) Transcript_27030:6-998(-)
MRASASWTSSKATRRRSSSSSICRSSVCARSASAAQLLWARSFAKALMAACSCSAATYFGSNAPCTSATPAWRRINASSSSSWPPPAPLAALSAVRRRSAASFRSKAPCSSLRRPAMTAAVASDSYAALKLATRLRAPTCDRASRSISSCSTSTLHSRSPPAANTAAARPRKASLSAARPRTRSPWTRGAAGASAQARWTSCNSSRATPTAPSSAAPSASSKSLAATVASSASKPAGPTDSLATESHSEALLCAASARLAADARGFLANDRLRWMVNACASICPGRETYAAPRAAAASSAAASPEKSSRTAPFDAAPPPRACLAATARSA